MQVNNKIINELGLTESTPLAMMTLGQFMAVLEDQDERQPHDGNSKSERRYVYGLRGIRELFHVSTRTAHIYKNTIIKDAVYQSGRTIVVDVDKALSLFDERRRSHE